VFGARFRVGRIGFGPGGGGGRGGMGWVVYLGPGASCLFAVGNVAWPVYASPGVGHYS